MTPVRFHSANGFMPPAARIIYWALIVTSAGCFGYAPCILMAWPVPYRDPQIEGFMAEITVNRGWRPSRLPWPVPCLASWRGFCTSALKKEAPGATGAEGRMIWTLANASLRRLRVLIGAVDATKGAALITALDGK